MACVCNYNARVIRTAAFLRPMTRLALLAVVLMAVMPSVGRLMASASTQVIAGWSELCTATGLQWVDTSKKSDTDTSAPGSGSASMGADCGYCRLVDLLPLVLLFVLAAFPRVIGASAPLVRGAVPRFLQNFRGLGGQGPPVLI